jgi:hypothetical protein
VTVFVVEAHSAPSPGDSKIIRSSSIVAGYEVTVFFVPARAKRCSVVWSGGGRIDRSMSIVAEVGAISDRRYFPLKSRAQEDTVLLRVQKKFAELDQGV